MRKLLEYFMDTINILGLQMSKAGERSTTSTKISLSVSSGGYMTNGTEIQLSVFTRIIDE